VQTNPPLTAPRKLPPRPPAIVGAKARNRFLKPIGITGTRFSRRKNDDLSVSFAQRRLLVPNSLFVLDSCAHRALASAKFDKEILERDGIAMVVRDADVNASVAANGYSIA
jgi:hypothetical protein